MIQETFATFQRILNDYSSHVEYATILLAHIFIRLKNILRPGVDFREAVLVSLTKSFKNYRLSRSTTHAGFECSMPSEGKGMVSEND